MGVNLKQGYNGDLTSRQAGSVGGQMVKNVCPVRKTSFHRENRTAQGHEFLAGYQAALCGFPGGSSSFARDTRS